MCGIYSVILMGEKNSEDVAYRVLEGLKRLEYRGYDSWGIAAVDTTHSGKIEVEKHVGKIGNVKKLTLPSVGSRVAIGHTRWATHGGVTQENAHPHLASDGSFALAQNGVVENYQELKKDLLQKGYTFVSQTDTEVIVHLIEKMEKEKTKNTQPDQPEVSIESISAAFQKLAGRNTIILLTKDGSVYAVRDGSPLVIGMDKQGNIFLSSDVVSLANDAVKYYSLNSREAVAVRPSARKKIQLINIDTLEEKALHFSPIDVSASKLDKAGFDHFMLKEIYEQSDVLHKPLFQEDGLFEKLVVKLLGARRVYTLGAGSADFVSGQIAFFLRQQGIPAQAVKSYEARSFQSLFGSEDVCIAVSQSGETADTVEVIEWMKAKGVTIASIVNMPGSTVSRLSDLPFMLQIGPEVGIASTKAVTSMITWGMAVAHLVGNTSGVGERQPSLEAFQKMVREYEDELSIWLKDATIQNQLKELASELSVTKDLFILGRGQLYMSALESALKLKEISYIRAEGFSGGELKHGVIALIEKETPVMCLVAEDSEKADMLNAAAEVKARGARVIGISQENNVLFDDWIRLPSKSMFAPISSILPAQLLTYKIALKKKLDPDKPRNLAKSVTVK